MNENTPEIKHLFLFFHIRNTSPSAPNAIPSNTKNTSLLTDKTKKKSNIKQTGLDIFLKNSNSKKQKNRCSRQTAPNIDSKTMDIVSRYGILP